MNYEVKIFYYVKLIKKWRKVLLIISGLSMAITTLLAVSKPVVYSSTITFLIPRDEEAAIVSSIGGLLGVPSFSIKGTTSELLIAIIRSKRMTRDIRERFKSEVTSKDWWRLYSGLTTGGMLIEVKGSDPELTERIANFCVENLDKINSELNITPNKPMVQVLDYATYGVPESRKILRKVIITGIFSFVFFIISVIFIEYIRKLKIS